jgi:hypothetical protein
VVGGLATWRSRIHSRLSFMLFRLYKVDLSKIRDNLRRERGSHAGACIQDMLFS